MITAARFLIAWIRHRLHRPSSPQEAGGDPWVAFLRGRALDDRRDAAGAFHCYLAASRGGHATAGTLAGLCYRTGHGATTDPVAALAWWREAAALGEPGAMVLLGIDEGEAP